MLQHVNEISVVVSAILSVALGSIWYSPMLFGNMISKRAGHLFDDTENSRRILVRYLFMGVIVQFFFSYFCESHRSAQWKRSDPTFQHGRTYPRVASFIHALDDRASEATGDVFSYPWGLYCHHLVWRIIYNGHMALVI
jgi:hypothetical protein